MYLVTVILYIWVQMKFSMVQEVSTKIYSVLVSFMKIGVVKAILDLGV
jgi:hypothetical protein